MIYLTVGEGFSGVYQSQVVDVCRYLRGEFLPELELWAMVSGRGFLRARAQLKTEWSHTRVFPSWPGQAHWRRNHWLLRPPLLFADRPPVIARGARAAAVAIALRDAGKLGAVAYDGRGAVAAEAEEHGQGDPGDAAAAERLAVTRSDYRLAVSHELIEWWAARYDYEGDEHVVIPTTLARSFDEGLPDWKERQARRRELGYTRKDVVLVYSGSLAGWQSLALVSRVLTEWLTRRPEIKVLFLSRPSPLVDELAVRFPGRVSARWVPPKEVASCLAACDHGLLLRAEDNTNRVASPTKFAEYLACGLRVVVSEHVGDTSEFVLREDCGMVLPAAGPGTGAKPPGPLADAERARLSALAFKHFSKSSHARDYEQLCRALGAP